MIWLIYVLDRPTYHISYWNIYVSALFRPNHHETAIERDTASRQEKAASI